MRKIKIEEVLKKNFHVKKVNNLALVGKKETRVLVKYPGNRWFPTDIIAKISDGQKTHRFRVVGDKLEFSFLGDSVEYLHSCLCSKAYMYENGKIILPQGMGQGYVVLTF